MISIDHSFHTIDPRVKLLTSLIFILGVILINHTSILCLSFSTVLFYSLMLRISIGNILRRIGLAFPFLALMVFVIPFQLPGKPIFYMDFNFFLLSASYEGLIFALNLWLKSLTSLLVLLILTEKTTFNDLQKALYNLHVPLIILHTMDLTLRYFRIIHQEFQRISRAQKSRCFQKGTSILHTYTLKTIGETIGHVFIRSIDRSERIYWAMASRGYHYRPISREPFSPSKEDFAWMITVFCFTCFVIWIDKGGVL
ncbi:MAG: cobalt ECF transporter T component CbiQ [Thermotaleaceae bacterium]